MLALLVCTWALLTSAEARGSKPAGNPGDREKALALLDDFHSHVGKGKPDEATALLVENHDFLMRQKLADCSESLSRYVERYIEDLVEKVKSKKKIRKLLDATSNYVETYASVRPKQSGSHRALASISAARGLFLKAAKKKPSTELWEKAADLCLKAAGIHHRLRRRGEHKADAIEYLCDGSTLVGAEQTRLLTRAVEIWQESRVAEKVDHRVKPTALAKAAATAAGRLNVEKRVDDATAAAAVVLAALRKAAEAEDGEAEAADIWSAFNQALAYVKDLGVSTEDTFQVQPTRIEGTVLQIDMPAGSHWKHASRRKGEVAYRFTRTDWYGLKTVLDLSEYEDDTKYRFGKATVRGADWRGLAKKLRSKYKAEFPSKGKNSGTVKSVMGPHVEKSTCVWWHGRARNGERVYGRAWVFRIPDAPKTWVLTTWRRGKTMVAGRGADLDAFIASMRRAE